MGVYIRVHAHALRNLIISTAVSQAINLEIRFTARTSAAFRRVEQRVVRSYEPKRWKGEESHRTRGETELTSWRRVPLRRPTDPGGVCHRHRPARTAKPSSHREESAAAAVASSSSSRHTAVLGNERLGSLAIIMVLRDAEDLQAYRNRPRVHMDPSASDLKALDHQRTRVAKETPPHDDALS